MPTREELKHIAQLRLAEAKALYDKGLYEGSRYLVGYVIELALKARICRVLDLTEYPDQGKIAGVFKTHDLSELILLAGLKRKFEARIATDIGFQTNWSLIKAWSEQFRYQLIGTNPRQTTEQMIGAVENREDGVFTWIKRFW